MIPLTFSSQHGPRVTSDMGTFMSVSDFPDLFVLELGTDTDGVQCLTRPLGGRTA